MWDAIIITPFINVVLFIYNLIGHNFGLAIILFTVLIKFATYPFTAKQVKSTKALQELQKDEEWLAIQKKYKNDRDHLAQAQMELYKKKGINPLASCLPTFIQLPIIVGLYQSIIQTMGSAPLQILNLATRISPWLTDVFSFIPWLQNPYTLIPLNSQFLWMDLGRPERIFIPGIPFGIPVLAVVVVISSLLQMKLMAPPSDSQASQATGFMNIYMPLLMGWFAYSFASGLAIYFVTSNIISIIQYMLLGKADFKNLFAKKEPAKN
ncbi:MAG TPA: YidC/Oxa1 family membrane protein insertase [Anaerolineae bacterium]|nr:YidC/Oxa1 family membrane protein insertase [Anaerolineae bacterium]